MLSRIFKLATMAVIFASPCLAETIRYSDMSERDFNAFMNGTTDDVAEFKRGDSIPLKIKVSGNILETVSSPATSLLIKDNFYVKNNNNNELLLSWDNREFLPIMDQIQQGKLQARISRDGSVSEFVIELEANR